MSVLSWEEEFADALLLRQMRIWFYHIAKRLKCLVSLMTLLVINESNIIMPRTLHQEKELFITVLRNFDSV